MPRSFNTLSRSEKIEFWRNLEDKIREALRQCAGRLTGDVSEAVSDCLDHNELGLAWETLARDLVALDAVPASARRLMVETGACMGFDQAGTRNHVLWEKFDALSRDGG